MKKWILLVLVVSLSFLKGWAEFDTLRVDSDFMAKGRQPFGTYVWRFINGDDIRYAGQEWDDEAAPLTSSMLKTEDSLYKQVHTGVGWFRIWVKAGPEIPNKSLAWDFSGYGLVNIYLDGVLLASIPAQNTDGKEAVKLDNHPVFFTLPDTLPHLIAVRYENRSSAAQNIYRQWGFSAQLMSSEMLFKESENSQKTLSVLILPIGSTFATLFMVHILMFFFYRKDISNLYFALFNLGCAAFLFTIYVDITSEISLGRPYLSVALTTISCVLACYSICAFCTYLFSKNKLFIRIILVIGVLMAIGTLFFYQWGKYIEIVESGLAAFAIVTSVYVVAIFIRAMVKKERGSSILGAGILFSIFFVFGTMLAILLNGGELATDDLALGFVIIIAGIFAIFSIPLSISSFLAWRYASTSKNLKKQLDNVAALSEITIQQEKEKQHILENQKAELEKEVAVRTEEIVLEKQKSDNLLLNILPQEVADELKQKGESKARYHDEVSVLFTDFVNFTTLSEKLGVEELLNELNLNFTAFDNIMEKYGLEKIKTIGDAYLAVSGLPLPDPAHARHAVQAALEILAFVEQRKQQVSYGLDIRIGIHSGALVAGIIGVKKFAYDIWGDTVNTAARMEQNSLPGKINLSEQTYRLVQNDFACTYRGKISVKGKGDLDMYFVEGEA